MPLVKDGTVVDDPWVAVDDEDPLPDAAPVIVSLGRWERERDGLRRRDAPLGIRLESDEPPERIAGDVHRLSLIALEFPKFTDGRAYSHARLLRERYRYAGELRAVGNVLRDQFLFMKRCGFDAFEVDREEAVTGWSQAMTEIDVMYQPAADHRSSVLSLRHGVRASRCRGGNGTPRRT